MKIVWNKVTWYSKLIAFALFILLPIGGFWFGLQSGVLVGMSELSTTSPQSGQQGSAGQVSPYYENTSTWQTDTRPDGGFSIAYPLDFTADDNYAITPVVDWRVGADNEPGQKMLAITIPKAFEPQTNFADATLTVGKSSNNVAVADCMQPDQTGAPVGTNMGITTTTINGITFSIFKSASAGAGNFYETTSYRTMHAGTCYAVEYTIHSSQIMNYPASYGLQPFDENTVTDVLERMVGTFKFL